MKETNRGLEYLPPPVRLNPNLVFTREVTVFAQGLKRVQNSKEPILFQIDRNGLACLTDGNHRAHLAWRKREALWGQCIGRLNFDVTTNPDYRPVSRLKIIR
ncbi:MAG: hypothetical protein PVJ09_03360 [Candidatus Woesebacteria bacterium]|jgi:hypothetical protein